MLEENTGQFVPLVGQGDGTLPAVMPTADQPTDASGVEAPVPDGAALPDGTSERTREQFEKLKEKNRQLAEQLAERQQPPAPKRPSVLEAMFPQSDEGVAPFAGGFQPFTQPTPQPQQFQNVSQQEYNQLIQSSIDPRDGQLDVNVLTQRLAQRDAQNGQATQSAQRAERQAQAALSRVEQFEVTQQVRALHQAYPEIDPDNSAFDPEAYDLVKKELLEQLVQTGKQDALRAANRMSTYFRKTPTKTPQQEANEAARAAASASVGSSIKPAYSSDQEFEDLKARSRKDKGALAERLARSGY